MSANGWFQIGLFFAVVFWLTKPVGSFLARVFNRERTFLDPLLSPIEKLIYRLTGISAEKEMKWTEYGIAMLLFSVVSMVLLYLIERTQAWLPLNPQHLANVAPDLAWNTAISFTTNTNWQAYVPESTMSYFTQMAGLAYHNFTSAAVGIALAVALIRGIVRKESLTIGNFWVDVTRGLLWVLLPACLVLSLVLVSQGVIQNFAPYTKVATIEGGTHVAGFRRALTRVFKNYGDKQNHFEKAKVEIEGDDYREGLSAIISVKVPEPQFEGQTKTKLGNNEVSGIVDTTVSKVLEAYLEENPREAKNIIQKVILAAQARAAARPAGEPVAA